MRYTIILPAFAAAALAQSSINYALLTNSLGVVTGQPAVVTTKPAAVTTQPAAAVVPAGANSTFVIVPTGSAANTSSHTNGTVLSTSLKSTLTSSTTSHSSSSTSSGSSTKTSGSTTTSSGSTTSTSKASSAVDMVQPVFGLGFAGIIFAAFL